jgi:hypothetical protein
VTYQYFTLPFCTPKEKQYKVEGLGEVLEGDRLVNTPYAIRFRVDKEADVLCSIELHPKDLQKFRTAVKNDYYFQARSYKQAAVWTDTSMTRDSRHVHDKIETVPGLSASLPLHSTRAIPALVQSPRPGSCRSRAPRAARVRQHRTARA